MILHAGARRPMARGQIRDALLHRTLTVLRFGRLPPARGRQRRSTYSARIGGRFALDQTDRALVLGVSARAIDRVLVETKLFELIAYERRSLLITANQPFGELGRIFPDQAMTLPALDRLVHHATIRERNVERYRRKVALDCKRGPGRPPVHATPNVLDKAVIDADIAV